MSKKGIIKQGTHIGEEIWISTIITQQIINIRKELIIINTDKIRNFVTKITQTKKNIYISINPNTKMFTLLVIIIFRLENKISKFVYKYNIYIK